MHAKSTDLLTYTEMEEILFFLVSRQNFIVTLDTLFLEEKVESFEQYKNKTERIFRNKLEFRT